jgi:hypothetical protein
VDEANDFTVAIYRRGFHSPRVHYVESAIDSDDAVNQAVERLYGRGSIYKRGDGSGGEILGAGYGEGGTRRDVLASRVVIETHEGYQVHAIR